MNKRILLRGVWVILKSATTFVFIGFGGEHQRLDRDEYINIEYEAVKKYVNETNQNLNFNGTMKNYLRCDKTSIGMGFGCLETGTPYDCQSISHRKRHIKGFEKGKVYEVIIPTEKQAVKACNYGQQKKCRL